MSTNSDPEHIRKRRTWLLESTRAFYREGRSTRDYSLGDWLHGYVYGRWPFLYIAIGTGEHPLAVAAGRVSAFFQRLLPRGRERKPGSVADGYHGKVIPVDVARQLVQVGEDLRVPDLEQVVPYPRARALILNNPDHIVALECPCRSARERPCLPLDVCLIIGEPFAGFVHEHHPDRSRRISVEQAQAILLAEHARGHVQHAFFKDAMLNRFYAICNCCSCCCGAMQAVRGGSPMLAPSGYVSLISQDTCIGCGDCVEICPFNAIELVAGNALVDRAACMGCGVCVDECSQEAVQLELAPDRGVPFEIARLMEQAAEAG